jgi:hypothetical protein
MTLNSRDFRTLYGGRKLDAPSEGNTRTKPMGERIRNALFNSIGAEIQDARRARRVCWHGRSWHSRR